VDQIDLKLLKLLQQRTKLSGEIGRTKRRHGAEIYVPGRERELLARVASQSGDKLPPGAVTAIFREILSSSRAAQGQAPIGLLRQSADIILPMGRAHFGACDRFVAKRSWWEIAGELQTGALALALLTFNDLVSILGNAGSRHRFTESMSLVGEFFYGTNPGGVLQDQIFIVMPSRPEGRMAGRRVLILIECKITASAVKSLLTSMPLRPIHSEHVNLSVSRGRQEAALLALTFAKAIDDALGAKSLAFLTGSDLTASILGIYPHGG
jgi:chorismate mutase